VKCDLKGSTLDQAALHSSPRLQLYWRQLMGSRYGGGAKFKWTAGADQWKTRSSADDDKPARLI